VSEFRDPFHISGTVEARNLIWHIDWPLGVLTKKCKIRSKEVVKGSPDLFEILGPPPYLGKVETKNFKFGTQIGHWGT